MKSIYNLLKEEVRQNVKIKNSILGNSHPWKRSHYIILSEIIKEDLSTRIELQNERKFELGTSISHITLQRFFESDYHFKTHNDLRFIKTLDKICIFLGFRDLNAYVTYVKEADVGSALTFSPEFSTEIIYRYCNTNFEFFKGFPAQNLHLFDDLVFSKSPFIERIKTYSSKLCEKNLKLATTNNRSSFEIFDLDVIEEETDKLVIKTQEFWNLVFQVENTNEQFVVNELNTQIYFVRKINSSWKIWDNYNPNSGLLNDRINKRP